MRTKVASLVIGLTALSASACGGRSQDQIDLDNFMQELRNKQFDVVGGAWVTEEEKAKRKKAKTTAVPKSKTTTTKKSPTTTAKPLKRSMEVTFRERGCIVEAAKEKATDPAVVDEAKNRADEEVEIEDFVIENRPQVQLFLDENRALFNCYVAP